MSFKNISYDLYPEEGIENIWDSELVLLYIRGRELKYLWPN